MPYALISITGGLTLLLLAQLGGLHQLSLAAAVLLVAGGIWMGITLAGRSVPPVLARTISSCTRGVWCAVALLLVAPAMLVMALALVMGVAQIVAGSPAGSTPLLVTGALVTLVFLVLMLAAVMIGIRALRGRYAHSGSPPA